MPINNYLTILSKPTYIRGRMSHTSRPLKNCAEKKKRYQTIHYPFKHGLCASLIHRHLTCIYWFSSHPFVLSSYCKFQLCPTFFWFTTLTVQLVSFCLDHKLLSFSYVLIPRVLGVILVALPTLRALGVIPSALPTLRPHDVIPMDLPTLLPLGVIWVAPCLLFGHLVSFGLPYILLEFLV